MICPQCNDTVRDGQKFCPSCGFRITAGAESPAHAVKTAPKRDKNWFLFGGIILLALAFYGGHSLYKWNEFRRAEKFAEIYYETKEYKKCAEQYRIIYRHTPKNVNARVRAAECLMMDKSYEDAMGELREAQKWNRDRAVVLAALGRLFYETKRYKLAERPLRDALKEKPDDWIAHLYLGLVLEALAKNDEAEKQLRAALKSPDKKEKKRIRLMLGDIAMQKGEFETAIREYKDVLYDDINNYKASYALARAYLALNDFTNAVMHIERAIRIDPTDKKANELADFITAKNDKIIETKYLAERAPLDAAYTMYYEALRRLVVELNADPGKLFGKKSPAVEKLSKDARDLLVKYDQLTPPKDYFDQNVQYKASASLLVQAVDQLKAYLETGDREMFPRVAAALNAIDAQNGRVAEYLEARKKRAAEVAAENAKAAAAATVTVPVTQ